MRPGGLGYKHKQTNLQFEVTGLYQTRYKEVGTKFIIHFAVGKKTWTNDIERFMRDGKWESNPIVKSTVEKVYEHTLEGTWSSPGLRKI